MIFFVSLFNEFISSEFSLSVIVTLPFPKVAKVLSLWYPSLLLKVRFVEFTFVVSSFAFWFKPIFVPILKLLLVLYFVSVLFAYVKVFVFRFRFSLSIKVFVLSYFPAARSEPFRWVLFPTFTFTLFPIREVSSVCFILTLPVFAPYEAFTEDTFPLPVLSPTFWFAVSLEATVDLPFESFPWSLLLPPILNPVLTLKPFWFVLYISLWDSITRSFFTFKFRVSFAFTFAPMKFASFVAFIFILFASIWVLLFFRLSVSLCCCPYAIGKKPFRI